MLLRCSAHSEYRIARQAVSRSASPLAQHRLHELWRQPSPHDRGSPPMVCQLEFPPGRCYTPCSVCANIPKRWDVSIWQSMRSTCTGSPPCASQRHKNTIFDSYSGFGFAARTTTSGRTEALAEYPPLPWRIVKEKHPATGSRSSSRPAATADLSPPESNCWTSRKERSDFIIGAARGRRAGRALWHSIPAANFLTMVGENLSRMVRH